MEKRRKEGRPGSPLLQRPLPHHRSGQVGERRLRDSVAGYGYRGTNPGEHAGRSGRRIVKATPQIERTITEASPGVPPAVPSPAPGPAAAPSPPPPPSPTSAAP